MDSSGQSQNELQRQAAAAIARRKVLAAYAKNPAQTASVQTGKLKDEPPKIDSESWKKYHTAWQDYYQKYYSNYYSNAARNYVEKERLKDARDKAAEEAIIAQTDTKLRHTLRKKALDSAKKSRPLRKWIPLLVGVAVVITILFLQYNRLIFAPIMAYISPGDSPASEIESVDPTITATVSPDPKLIIPKLNINVPVHFGISLDEVMSAMNNGVAQYRIPGASAYPGEIGNLVITGHSAGDVYSSNQYKYIFSGLERLENGDLIYVNYKSTRYTYRVVRQEVVEPTNVQALVINAEKPMLTLVTCTPLGTSRYRLLVFAEQISPSTEDAQIAIDTPTETTKETLPDNEPTFFDRIWNWLTGN